MKIALITAGGAGMFCGSCMQDNTMVRALRMAGHDAVLVPTYTPIRVDEDNASSKQVFLGGINVYLDSTLPGFRYLPRWSKSWLDRPSVIRTLSKFGTSTDASGLGALTMDMVKGSAGPQRSEYKRFADFLCDELQPDVIVFSNALLSGVLDQLRPRFSGRIECLLQGDDIFLEGLKPKWKPRVLQQLCDNCRHFDGFLAHSDYYRRFMSNYLEIDRQRIRQIPLAIDVEGAIPAINPDARSNAASDEPHNRIRIGYFARICPEKGAQQFLDAALEVLKTQTNVEFVIAGFLPKQHERWFSQQYQKAIGLYPDGIFWLGSPPDRESKFRMISSFDHLCVPTEYREPKGLYVLEAALTGVPSMVPDHGAFPEVIERLNFGTLFDHTNQQALVNCIHQAIAAGSQDKQTAQAIAKQTILQHHGMEAAGKWVGDLLSQK
ncbi:MAG: glycosyltransferase family 4 protein [Fuerstiella sp.]